jgi:hypothetical protein
MDNGSDEHIFNTLCITLHPISLHFNWTYFQLNLGQFEFYLVYIIKKILFVYLCCSYLLSLSLTN